MEKSSESTTPDAAAGGEHGPASVENPGKHDRAALGLQSFDEIVVPIDGSDHGIRALRLARHLSLARPVPIHVWSFGRDLAVEVFRDRIRGQASGTLLDVPFDVKIAQRSHSVSEDITRILADHPGALLCMPTHGHGRSAGLLGSVTAELLAQLERPILLAGPRCEGIDFTPNGHVLVAVDPEFDASPAERAAAEWSTTFGGSFESIAVSELEDDRVIAAEVVEEADRVGASLIAMVSHGRRGLARLVQGSITADVLRTARQPVLVVVPDEE